MKLSCLKRQIINHNQGNKSKERETRMTEETVVKIVMEMRESIKVNSVLNWPAIKADIWPQITLP
jgi:hypothetical protein